MVNDLKPQLKDSYEWGSEVYVKVSQADKLETQLKVTRWVGHANLSHGHYIYWPDFRKVSIERNIIFPSKEGLKFAPIIPANENKPTYTCQKLLDSDPSNIPLPDSPTSSEKSADDTKSWSKIEN
jgi:hypothetical protein